MKVKKVLFVFFILILLMGLVSCDFGGPGDDNGNGQKKDADLKPKPLDDLTDYGSEARYYNVTKVTYSDTSRQEALLRSRIEEKSQEDYYDLSVPLRIFVESDPGDIIETMSLAALSYDKMTKTVEYLAGQTAESPDIDSIVASGEWENDMTWCFFDDWDYYEALRDRADESSEDKDSDNVLRQRRKMMKQIYSIGLSGDEFGRLVYEMLTYALEITESMHTQKAAGLGYDEWAKRDLSYDALVYLKSFRQFAGIEPLNKAGKSAAVKLYGYYYDYNKAVHNAMDDETFEDELMFSHMKKFSHSQFEEYLEIQRNNYAKAYRYSAEFYRKFYNVHFQFQTLMENYDIEVYGIGPATDDEQLRYTTEMKAGMEAGFSQQLTLTDWLYVYSLKDQLMKDYNLANTQYQNVKNSGSEHVRNEKEFLLNIERLKIVDYIMENMSNTELSGVLKYQIKSYSGDMLRNIQSEKKEVVLEIVDREALDPLAGDYDDLLKASQIKEGRTNAIIAQLIRNYSEAGIQSQFTSANSAPWKNMHTEIKAALEHDYNQYANGTAKKEALENMLIKKKWSCGGVDESDCRLGDGHATCIEEYDESHNISRFLADHESVLLYSVGQVKVELAGAPQGGGEVTYNKLKDHPSGTYRNGNNGDNRNMPDGVVPTNFPKTIADMTFEAGLTLAEAMAEGDDDEKNFLDGHKTAVELDNEIDDGGVSGVKKYYRYTFEGWYIDSEHKYQVDKNEKVKYSMILYPGYIVETSSTPFS